MLVSVFVTRAKRKKILLQIGDTNGDGILNEKDFDSMDDKATMFCDTCGEVLDSNGYCSKCGKFINL